MMFIYNDITHVTNIYLLPHILVYMSGLLFSSGCTKTTNNSCLVDLYYRHKLPCIKPD